MTVPEFILRLPAAITGRTGRILRHKLTKFGAVRIMAMSAQQVEFFPVPLAHSPSMNTPFPVAVNQSVALAAKPIGFFKRNGVAVD
jgi:hypothetical protein